MAIRRRRGDERRVPSLAVTARRLDVTGRLSPDAPLADVTEQPAGRRSAARRFERLLFGRRVWAGYASLVVHLLIGLGLVAWSTTLPPRQRPAAIDLRFTETDDRGEPGIRIEAAESLASADGAADEQDAVAEAAGLDAPSLDPSIDVAPPAFEPHTDSAAIPMRLASSPLAARPPAATAAATGQPAASGSSRTAFASRQAAARAAGVARHGGSGESEAAVERGLDWLARHQASDGSWRFDLSDCHCDGGCSCPGTVTSTTAATGVALLPFLGAGHTHEEGRHRETVTRGLYYLMSRMQLTPRGGDLSEGTMYGHGVAALALAEALGMTGDRMLLPYVRDATRFIETAQDLHGGGWRYLPGQAGDTTVTAWQLAALKSSTLAGVPAPSPTIDGVCRFLDRVQVRDGEGYGYLAPQDRPCTSAIGLLCRIYTAWPQEASLDRGLTRLAKGGPDPEQVYQNFYLSQALLLRGHPLWKRWNARNREQLVTRQARRGHEAGSWSFVEVDTRPGGRLGHTALAVLTLEVYYRLLPIYGEEAATTGW